MKDVHGKAYMQLLEIKMGQIFVLGSLIDIKNPKTLHIFPVTAALLIGVYGGQASIYCAWLIPSRKVMNCLLKMQMNIKLAFNF